MSSRSICLASTVALSLGLHACQSAEAPSENTVVRDQAQCQANWIQAYSDDWQPLPAAAELSISPETQAARDQILGPNATDPDTVKLWWFGVSSFIASAGGHLFLFDAWEIVGAHADYVPIGREELAALQPEAIFIGHGHFDHAGDMGYIVGRSGATIVGGEATCATAREQASRDGNQSNFDCLILGDANQPEPGTLQSIKIWQDMEPLSILRHTHSNAQAEDLTAGGLPFIFVPELVVYLQHLNSDPQEISWMLQSLDDEAGNSPPGGVWAYHLKLGDFTLLWHDSAGPIADGKAFAEDIQCGLSRLPACVDVHVGTIVGFGSVTSGLRDVALYPQHTKPKIFLPNHHDAWAPVVGPGAESYEAGWREEIAKMQPPPELDYLNDPEDYLQVREFHLNDPRWASPVEGSSCALQP